MFFLVLKEGCRVELLQLCDTKKLQTVRARRVARRVHPEQETRAQGNTQAQYCCDLIAQRGGFLAREHDGERRR